VALEKSYPYRRRQTSLSSAQETGVKESREKIYSEEKEIMYCVADTLTRQVLSVPI
jgi:hypothetical protein